MQNIVTLSLSPNSETILGILFIISHVPLIIIMSSYKGCFYSGARVDNGNYTIMGPEISYNGKCWDKEHFFVVSQLPEDSNYCFERISLAT